MALTQAALGKRLQDARSNIGLTQQEVAAKFDWSRETMAQIEAGDRSVSSLELVRLARLFNRSVTSLLVPQEDAEADETPLLTLFRTDGALDQESGFQAELVRFFDIFREGVLLERLMGEPERQLPPDYDLPSPKTLSEAYSQGQFLAKQERMRLSLGERPIGDVAELIAALGVWATAAPLPDDVSGLCLTHRSIGAAILVNSTHARGRRRFSYAHEYCHVLSDRKTRPSSVTKTGNQKELIERRANSFASGFLMPAAAVAECLERLDKGAPSRELRWVYAEAAEAGELVEKRNAPGSQEIRYQDVAFIAHRFKVSYDAAAYRLSDLGKINRDRLTRLIEEKSQGRDLIKLLMLHDFEGVESEGEDQPYLGSHIGRLALEAYRREAISGGRLREVCNLAGLDGDAILELAQQGPEE